MVVIFKRLFSCMVLKNMMSQGQYLLVIWPASQTNNYTVLIQNIVGYHAI